MQGHVTDSATRNVNRPTWLGAILALVVMLVPAAAHAQYDRMCSDTNVAVGDFIRYRECDIDFDDNGSFERTAEFLEVQGSASNPPHETDGDRHCYQPFSFEGGSEPDAADFNYIHFSLLLPENDTSDFPVLLALRGGGLGWSDIGPLSVNSWRLDTDDADPANWTWDKGLYQGRLDLADGTKDEDILLEFLLDDDGNIVDELRQEFPGWAILVPSGCSHDQWNGHPDLDDGAPEFKNAAQTRYSYAALRETLDWVDDQYGIEYLYVVGGSGGGTGGFLLSHRLPVDRPGIDLRGVVSEAAAPEAEAREDLFDASDERDVYADDSCTGTQATVPCEAPAEPFATANEEVGLTGHSISTLISNEEVEVPILHMYNKRDFTHCYDFCYSETDLHGAIRDAIEARTAGGWNEDFDASASVEMCVGEGRVGPSCEAYRCSGLR